MDLIFLSAFVAGLAYCVTPGVINTEAIRRAVTHGFRAALLFQVGALVGDAVWAAVALSGVVVLRPWAGLHVILGVCGAVLLVWMAWNAVRDSLRGQASLALQPRCQADLRRGALLSLANPFAIVFWLSVGDGVLPAGALTAPLPTAAMMIGAFILATVIWSLLLATVACYARRLITIAACRWLNAGAGVGMAVFGFGVFWQTLAAR
jgi:chemosensory pili system protein ChpE